LGCVLQHVSLLTYEELRRVDAARRLVLEL